MQRKVIALCASGAGLAMAPAAFAASDYFLAIGGVQGDSETTIEIASWSWGVSQHSGHHGSAGTGRAASGAAVSPRDPASGQASGKRSSFGISEPGGSTGGQPQGIAIDEAGVHVADLASLHQTGEVQGFTLAFDKASPKLMELCAKGARMPVVEIRSSQGTYGIENALVTACSSSPPPEDGDSRRAGKVKPVRITMDAASRQTQGATFGERCSAQGCPSSAPFRITITGQLKHTKTGHVTILK